jgi:hypothetical protein
VVGAGTVALPVRARETWIAPSGVRWPWCAAAGVAGLSLVAVVLSTLAGEHGDAWWTIALGAFTVLVSTALGVLIALRRPGNRMAWLLLANAAIIAVGGIATAAAQYAVLESPGALPGAAWAVLWDQSGWPLLFAPAAGIALLFPDGRLPSPRWRLVAIGVIATFAGALTVSLLDPEPFDAPYERVENPLPGVSGIGWLWPLVMLGGIASLIAAVCAVRLRFRRARGLGACS